MKVTVNADTTTDVTPTDTRFFYVTDTETAPGTTLTIDAADFFDDGGAAVTELPELLPDNSYYNVYINGVIQMDGLTTYTPGTTGTGSLEIDVPDELDGGTPILTSSPIVLEILNYTTNSTTEITT